MCRNLRFSTASLALFSLSVISTLSNGVSGVQFSVVLIQRNDQIVCAGTMKDPQTVITAANCVSEGEMQKYKVVLDEAMGYTADIATVTKHADKRGNRNNIAMLHLTAPAKKGAKRVRIKGRLPTRVYDDKVIIDNPRCLLLDPHNEREVSVEMLTNSRCARELGKKITDEQICVHRDKDKRRKCPTGIGNPVVCRIDEAKWVQVAIHIDDGCSSPTMVATRLSHFRAWMRSPSSKMDSLVPVGPLAPKIIDTDDVIPDTDDNGDVTNSTKPDNVVNPNVDVNNNSAPDMQKPCNTSEFRCADGSCIPTSSVCDGIIDCPCGSVDESACGCSLEGTEFVTGFLDNVGPEVAILYISSPEVTRVTVYIPFLAYNETREVNQAEKWTIDDTTLVITEKNTNKGVHITSDKPITVIAANSREFSYSTVDGTIVYPLECLSTDHLVEVQKHRFYKTSQYAIIGVQDTLTDVTIVNRKGRTFTPQLGFLDSYFLQEKDLRGTTITASGRVVVLSGAECGYVPSTMSASCDHMVNQIPARSMVGDTYIIAPQKPRTGFTFRVQATEDNTTVVLRESSGEVLKSVSLDVGTEFEEIYLDSHPLSVKANKGVMVTQYALDAKIDDIGQGDPSMIVLQSLNTFDTKYNFVVPDHFLRVTLAIYISSCHNPEGLRVDGEEISTCGMTLVKLPGVGDYNVIHIDLGSKWDSYSYGNITHIERDVSFGAFMYGTRVEGAFAWRIGGKL